MTLCSMHGGYLFQVLPHLFPEGYLTPLEMGLWGKFYEERSESHKMARRKNKR